MTGSSLILDSVVISSLSFGAFGEGEVIAGDGGDGTIEVDRGIGKSRRELLGDGLHTVLRQGGRACTKHFEGELEEAA